MEPESKQDSSEICDQNGPTSTQSLRELGCPAEASNTIRIFPFLYTAWCDMTCSGPSGVMGLARCSRSLCTALEPAHIPAFVRYTLKTARSDRGGLEPVCHLQGDCRSCLSLANALRIVRRRVSCTCLRSVTLLHFPEPVFPRVRSRMEGS